MTNGHFISVSITYKPREYNKELDLSNIRNELNRIVSIAQENSIDFSRGFSRGYFFTDAVLTRMKNIIISEITYRSFSPTSDDDYYFELEWNAKEKENKNKKSSEKNEKDSRQRTYSESDNGSTSFSEGLVKSLVIMKYDPKDRPTKEELIKKYKKLININHPDQYQNDDERKEYFEEETKKINVSFDYLMSDEGFGYKKKQK